MGIPHLKDMIRKLSAICVALVGAFVSPVHANPAADLVEARILTGWRDADGRHVAALHLELQDGWKTYWRAPGDAGIPPRFDWSGSGNLARVALHWPAPKVFDSYGLRTVGYDGALVLPMELTPRRPGAPITLNARMELGICETICVPAELHLEANLAGPGRSDPA